ncbi:MAG: flagellar hook-associated protein FlgK [Planctomycetes bacterium]|nr:flagellar hook-associated protein FlgK [Planctomycetota bacterium]
MSLFSAIQGSANALRVNQLGLQIVGNNISNVNTPGYIRQELIQAPALGYRAGDMIIGQGVQAVGVQQKLDEFVVDRLRQTQSQLSYQETIQGNNAEIESLLNELSDTDLSTRLSTLANAFQDVANQPGNESYRTLAIQRGQELASHLKSISGTISQIAERNRDEVEFAVDQINRLVKGVASLNQRIIEIEGGTNSDAVGLRDERLKVLDELSSFVDITVTEQLNGSVTVFVGGDYLVADATLREVEPRISRSGDTTSIEIIFKDTDAPLNVQGGKLRGLYEIANATSNEGFSGKIDALAKDVIRVVNRIHTQGQGTRGFNRVRGDSTIQQPDTPLEVSNPNFDIDNGSFVIQVTDARTRQTTSYDIPVKQLGLSSDTTATSLAASIDGINGLSATVTNDGKLEIQSDSSSIQFSFSNDTSGVLAALGINTFFVGDSMANIAVRQEIVSDPSLLAISVDGVGNGAGNALKIAEAFTQPSEYLGGRSLNGIYDSLVSETTREINTQKGVTEGLRNFKQTLESRHLGLSGVNLDEEAVKMMLYQRAFQASAKMVSAVSELLESLINIV